MSDEGNYQTAQLKQEMRLVAKKMKITNKNTTSFSGSSKIPKPFHKQETFTVSKLAERSPLKTVNSGTCKPSKSTAKKPPLKRRKFIQRPVDYTWNRGGRLKEIRIRTQARKFLSLWKLKTFGKITFADANSFYKKSLIKKYFFEWKADWWEKCGEWRLNAKADIHFRYKCYNKVWQHWNDFKKLQQLKRHKVQIANQYFAAAAGTKHLAKWKTYVQLRKMKKNLYSQAYAKAAKSRTKKAWLVWVTKHRQHKNDLKNCQVAALHWAKVTQLKTWRMWVSHFNAHLEYRGKEDTAIVHYTSALKVKALIQWRGYILERRQKTRRMKKALGFHIIACKEKMFLMWRKRLANMQYCSNLAITTIKRKYFIRWLQYVQQANLKRRKEAMASIHNKTRLLTHGTRAFVSNIQYRHWKIEANVTALQFHKTKLQEHALKCWLSRIEGLEEAELQDLNTIAREHYSMTLRKNGFYAFLCNSNRLRIKRQNLIKAEAHFVIKTLPKYFCLWRTYVEQSRKVTKLKRLSNKFHSDVLLSKHFYAWWSRFDEQKEIRTMERMAVLHYNENLMRSCVGIWRMKTSRILLSNKQDAIARVHYRKALLHRTIECWKIFTEICKDKEKKFQYAVSYHHNSQLAGAWIAWQQYVSHRKIKLRKSFIAEEHHSTTLMKRSMAAWLQYKNTAKHANHVANEKAKQANLRLLKVVFVEWKVAVVAMREKRIMNVQAMCHRNQFLQNLIFQKWREWSTLHCYRKQQVHERICNAARHLNQCKLRRAFRKWKYAAVMSKHEKALQRRACQHHNRKVCRVAFQAWILYRYLKLKKTLMARQAEHFYDSATLKRGFEVWMVALSDKHDENRKTGDALWHWALSLQSKCLQHWRQYIEERKRKKARYADAMDRRRYLMVREGCAQMLQYHSEELRLRMRHDASKQAQMRYSAYHLAWKYGQRWVAKVRSRMQSEGGRPAHHYRDSDESLSACDPQLFASCTNTHPWIPRPIEIPENLAADCKALDKANRRPSPRLPQFLNDSLQREGLYLPQHDVVLPSRDSDVAPIPQTEPHVTTPSRGLEHISSLSAEEKTSPGPYFLPVPIMSAEKGPSRAKIYQPRYDPSVQTEQQDDLVLLPPSAFTLSPKSPPAAEKSPLDHTGSPSDRLPVSRGYDSPAVSPAPCKSACTGDNTPREHASPVRSTRPFADDFRCQGDGARSVTSQTFVASPARDPVKDELVKIHARLKEFQELKQRLKLLKQQKIVLETWLNENFNSASTSASLDVTSVENEIEEFQNEVDEITRELSHRKPEVEKLALRIRVLSAKPT